MLTLWYRIAERPLGAKMAAGIVLAGIVSLMASPDVLSHGKASATSFAKSGSSQVGSMEVPRDCSSDRDQTPDTLP